MNFAQAMRNESTKTYTENGARARNTSSNALVDLFGTIGSLRMRDNLEVERIFSEAYKMDPLVATKIAFYGRDVREGLGERKVFRTIIKYLAQYHPEAIRPNLDLIGVYGRYDDLYELIGTSVEDAMWSAMKTQFEEDLRNLEQGNAVSLLGKWIKTPDASSKNTRRLGILTAQKLGYSVYDFKRHLRALRKHIDIVERHLSAKEYSEIKYSEVPSRAMLIYRKSFMRNDADRYNDFIAKAVKGEVKINSATLFPYDIVKSMICGRSWGSLDLKEDATLEAQWKQLPNYVEESINALVISDLSGSMTCMNYHPIASSIGLAIYFAERNHGAYQDLFIPFSTVAHVVDIKGETLAQKIKCVFKAGGGYCGSTNLEAAFNLVLDIAIKNHIPQEDMVKSLIVISDMEINQATGSGGWYSSSGESWSFYDDMRARFEQAGYEIPNVVFWNVNSRNDVFHADANRTGVQLCSGQSASTFKQLLSCIGYTPVEMMMKVIGSERYSAIKIE